MNEMSEVGQKQIDAINAQSKAIAGLLEALY